MIELVPLGRPARGLTRRSRGGFTLVELLVGLVIIGILMHVALPSMMSNVLDARTGVANSNASQIVREVQAEYMVQGATSYLKVVGNGGGAGTNVTLATLASDLGGAIPKNPCTGGNSLASGTSDYVILSSATGFSIKSATNANCNTTTTYQVGTSP